MSRDKKANDIRRALNQLAAEHPLKWTVNDLRIILGLERIIARLQDNPILSKHLIFKGGFVLLKAFQHDRFTRDVDALAQDIDQNQARKMIIETLQLDLNDGIWFGDIQSDLLEFTGEYGTLRFDCAYQIGDPPGDNLKWKKLSRIHFDIGFSDRIPKNIKFQKMKPILDSENVKWKIYPPEFIFSEKLEMLIVRGSANSRAKDIYDLLFLLGLNLDRSVLLFAIQTTFENRKTDLPKSTTDHLKGFDTTTLEMAWKSMAGKNRPELDFKKSWLSLIEKIENLKLK